MKTPPFNDIEIELPGKEELVGQRDSTKNPNNDSISSELSLDLLLKDRNDDEDNDDSKLQSSSGSCRWNPDDSDYSLNVLLPPSREDSTDSIARKGDDSVVTKDSLLGSDYSLNKLRARPSKCGKLLDASSHHSTISVDTLDTEFSVRSKLPESVELKKPKAKGRETLVSFYPRVRIQRVPPRKMIPRDQMHAVWYCRDEFHVIRQECFKTIRLMSDNEDENDETHPLFDEENNELSRRGLEYKTPKAYKRRQKQKKDVRNVVFDELEFQEEQGMNDPMWLAKLSREQSRACVEAAIEAAQEDERVANQYLGR
mmetsp:Transcript_868/g.1364  ORF Transcript_868/g.1364 Transcript_868/m.1364 type:complete len:313 (-) Transcript_868:97-1035(-)